MMGKAKQRTIFLFVALFFVLALSIVLMPVRAYADTASDTAAAQKSRNDNLIVKYGLDETSTSNGAKIAAYKWDGVSQTFVANPSMDATAYSDRGAVSSVSGVEGSGALSFTEYSHTEAPFALPSAANGMTVSMWVKNVDAYWGALVELWDGNGHGGRFGKGPIQGNGGNKRGWSANGELGEFHNGGGNSTFITNDGDDKMDADKWYHITFTLSGTGGDASEYVMKGYRDGVLKRTYSKSGSNMDCSNITKSILDAAKSSNCKISLHLFGDGNPNDKNQNADYLDDFRVYNGVMSDSEVQALYGEYNGIKALGNKKVKIDGDETEYTVNNGNNVKFNSTEETFPKILLGGVAASGVTESSGTYSASGDGFDYSYTVGEYAGNERTATVTYTSGGVNHIFTVTQVNPDIVTVRLTSLKVKINDGEAVELDEFASEKTSYTLNLSPDTYKIEFVSAVEEGGTTNTDEVNASINYNGDNVINTIKGPKVSVSYTVTVSRNRADQASPTLSGTQIGANTQVVYVNSLPVSASDIIPHYQSGSEVQDFTYNEQTKNVSFSIVDKIDSTNKTDYSITLKTKKEGQIAFWSFDESVNGENKVFAGKRYDATQNKLVEDAALNMAVYPGADNEATANNKTPKAATVVSGMIGNGVDLGSYGYACADVAAVPGATGFTFGTWMKLEGSNAWEAVVAVSDTAGTKGTILEKGHMQSHSFSNGQPVNGWGHLSDATGEWTDSSLNNNDKKGAYFNTPASGQSYVFFTVTVEYVSGSGTVKFYKNGELAATHNDTNASNKAKVIIEALNEGANIGLHRHHYDSGNSSKYDETSVYAYAMTAEEVSAQYETQSQFAAVAVDKVSVSGLDYPDVLLGGATSVSGTTVKTATATNGVTYSYTPLTGTPTKATDDSGVAVTLSRNGFEREISVRYERTLTPLTASKLGYKVGDEAKQADVTAGSDSVTAEISTADINRISAGTSVINKYDGDNDDSHYNIDFAYNATERTATVTLTYRDYTNFVKVYTITFSVLRDGTGIQSITVTVENRDINLTGADFVNGVAEIEVESLEDIVLTVKNAVLDDGATLEGAQNGELTFTAEDLQDGKFTFKVKSELHTEAAYSVKPNVFSANADLSALSFGSYVLSPDFSANVLAYTLTVNAGEGSAAYKAMTLTASDAKSTVVKHYNLSDGIITITVTAENKRNEKVYTVTIAELDTDATLAGLNVGGELITGFSAEKTEYTYKYTGNVPTVTAVPSSGSASLEVGEYTDGKVTVTVTAENGTTKKYTVTFVLKSSDASISKLTINGVEVTLGGDSGEVELSAGTKLNNLSVIVKTASGAKAEYKTENSTVKITVTAEDGTQKTYTVAVSVKSGDAPEQPNNNGVITDESPELGGCGSSVVGSSVFASVVLLILAICLLACKKEQKY